MRKRGLLVPFALILILGILYMGFVYSSGSLKQGELRVTTEHPFLVDNVWTPASQLQVGDELTTPDGKKARVTSIEDVTDNSGFNVYNFETRENDYVAGGVVVHNSNKMEVVSVTTRFKFYPGQQDFSDEVISNFVTDLTLSRVFESADIPPAVIDGLNSRYGLGLPKEGVRIGKVLLDLNNKNAWFWKGERNGAHHLDLLVEYFNRYYADKLGVSKATTYAEIYSNPKSAEIARKIYSFELQEYTLDGKIHVTGYLGGGTENFKGPMGLLGGHMNSEPATAYRQGGLWQSRSDIESAVGALKSKITVDCNPQIVVDESSYLGENFADSVNAFLKENPAANFKQFSDFLYDHQWERGIFTKEKAGEIKNMPYFSGVHVALPLMIGLTN